MGNVESKIIMPKRKRELKGLIFILRGVPGTGKTTIAHRLYERLKEPYDYRVQIVSRDDVRKHYCVKHDIDYQSSFRDPIINTLVRDKFYRELTEWVEYIKSHAHVLIIDATNTKLADLKQTLWCVNRRCVNCQRIGDCHPYDIYLYTRRKEFGSIHGVPECIMKRFREEITESDHWLSTHGYHYNIIVKQ